MAGPRQEVGKSSMKAAQLVAPGRFEIVEVPLPTVGAGEVLVAMRRASICGSDLHAVFGAHPRAVESMPPGAPGHEGIGEVVVSRAEPFSPADLVLTVPMPGSGGCYAEHQVVGADFLVRLPENGDTARLLLAQQLGTTVYSFRRYWPAGLDAEGATAAIVGAGSAGLFLLQLVKLAGFAHVVVCDLDETRLEVAAALGADVIAHAPSDSFVEAVRRVTRGAGAELVVEATGLDQRRADCVEAVRYGGRIGFFGLPEHAGPVPFPLAQAFRRACTIEMAGNAQLEPGLRSFRESLDLISSGAITVEHMLEPRFSLLRFQEAFEAARDHVGVKISVDLTGVTG